MLDNKSQIQERIINEVNSTNPNYSQLIAYIQNVANNKGDSVGFTVDSSIITRLGEELVGKQETAVCELIKNSYDADATYVDLTFNNSDIEKDYIRIQDNGAGMTKDQLINSFMRLGTNSKVVQPYSKILQRKKAGRKGIGRIASQRLGDKLIVRTKAYGYAAYELEIDWELLEKAEDIYGITFPIREIDESLYEDLFGSREMNSGTVLIIERLKDNWNVSDVKRIYKYIADLIQPIILKGEINDVSSDYFEVTCFLNKNGKFVPIERTNKIVYDYALAEIEASIFSDGYANYSVKSNKLDIKEDNIPLFNEGERYLHAKNVKLKAYYYIQGKAGLLSKGQNSLLREYIEEGRVGIRVYKNGFRILPYAEKGNDWLDLDVSYSDRKFLFPHSNDNFLGLVSISDSFDETFQETSSREGLIENEAYEELKKFCYSVLIGAGTKIAEVRGRKVSSSQKDWNKVENPVVKLQKIQNQLVDYLVETTYDLKENKNTKEEVILLYDNVQTIVSEKIHELSGVLEEQINRETNLIEEIAMLRVLATLGITVAEFTHEMRNYIPAIQTDIKSLDELFNLYNIYNEKLTFIFKRLSFNVDNISTYINIFDETVKGNVNRSVEPQSLLFVLIEFENSIKDQLFRYGIELKVEFKETPIFTAPMHFSELVAILYNLWSNSRKAIQAVDTAGKILITVYKQNGKAIIEFNDNGIGIDPENEHKIFNAFYTTTLANSYSRKESNDLSGSGLGLWIVNQIIEGYGGRIELIAPSKGYRTCFKIELPLR